MASGNDHGEQGILYTWEAGKGVTKRETTEVINTHQEKDEDKPKRLGADHVLNILNGRAGWK
jgi:hypothetical protein